MAIFRTKKENNFVIMSNYHLRDKNLSFKAKGLLSYMLSLPDDWNYSISGLICNAKENKTSIKSALNELIRYGYLNIKKLYPNQTESKKIEDIYDIYELPHPLEEDMENLELDNMP